MGRKSLMQNWIVTNFVNLVHKGTMHTCVKFETNPTIGGATVKILAHICINILNTISAKIMVLGTQVPHGNMLNTLKHALNSATMWPVIKHFTFWLITHELLGVE